MRAGWERTRRAPGRRGRAVMIGALAGAVGGTVLLFSDGSCRTPESMCGLSIPLHAGGGALLGGAVGYVVARSRR
jgi:hypothetical protein